LHYNATKTRVDMAYGFILPHMQDAYIYVFALRNLKFSDWRDRFSDSKLKSVLEPKKGYYMAHYEESAFDRDSEKRIA
jgi:hypothetical protein